MTLAHNILQNLEAANQNLHLFGIFASPGQNDDDSHTQRTNRSEGPMILYVQDQDTPLELSWHSNVCAVTRHDEDFVSYACAYESFQKCHQSL